MVNIEDLKYILNIILGTLTGLIILYFLECFTFYLLHMIFYYYLALLVKFFF